MQNVNIMQFSNVIADFAKQNKISRAKLEAFTAAVVASIPQGNTSAGRKPLERTMQRQNALVEYIRQGKTDALSLRDCMGLPQVEFNNLLADCKRRGIIKAVGKLSTGKRGRQPQVFSL